MYVNQTVERPSGNPGRALMVHDEIRIVDVADIKAMPKADEAGVVIADDVVLKSGAYGIGIYLTPGTAEVTDPSEGDPDQEGFKPQVKFNHPGNKKEIREFKHNWINRNVIVFISYCDGTVDMIGSPCNPCRLQTSYTGNKDGNSNEIVLAQANKGDGIYVYEGAVPSDKTYSITASATAIDYSGRGTYSASAGNALKSITGGSEGDIITIAGASDSSKSTTVTSMTGTDTSTGNILLKTSSATLPAGTQITLRAVQTVNGLVWIEQSRTTI